MDQQRGAQPSASHPASGFGLGGDSWRGAQMVLVSARAVDVPHIARVTFTSKDSVRDVILNFKADGFGRSTRATRAAGRLSIRSIISAFVVWMSCSNGSGQRCPSLRRDQPQPPGRMRHRPSQRHDESVRGDHAVRVVI